MQEKVLLVGWHPDVVDFEKWSELTPEKLTQGFETERSRLKELGIDARWQLIRDAAKGARELADALGKETYDVVLIGAGVRKDDDHFLAFETLVNVIHEHARRARIAFNTNPSDTAEAIQRWTS